MRRRITGRNMEIEVLVGGRVGPGGVVRLQPPSRFERKHKAGGLNLDSMNIGRLIGKNITKGDPLVACSEVNCNCAMICIAENQAAMVQEMIHPRRDSCVKFVLFSPAFDFSDLVNDPTLLSSLVVSSESKWRRAEDGFAAPTNLVTEFTRGAERD